MGSLPKPIKKIIKIDIAVILIILTVLNPMGSSFAAAVNSQEFFTYHLRDFIEYFDEEEQETGEFYLARGTYENGLDGELFGAAKGRNLIVVQMESMQNMVVNRDYMGQEITPVLNGLIASPGTLYFDNFYYQIGSGNTSDAEFAVNNSIMASMESFTYKLYRDNYFRGLPRILSENGYGTYVLHGYKKEFWNRENMYPALGFEKFYSAEHFVSDNIEGIGGGNIVGISDSAFFEQAADYMTGFPQPFYSFLITLSCHNPFKLPNFLKDIEIGPRDEGIVGDYINAAHYADRCIGEFMERLKEKGLYENSIIVLYGDHFGLSKADSRIDEAVSNWLGEPYRYDMMLNVPLLIHIPGQPLNATYENSGGQLDMLPTLAYLLGIERLDTIYLGQNLMTGEDSAVAFQAYMLKGSYVKGDLVFEMSRDGIFDNSKAWNRRTGEELSIEGCFEDYKKAESTVDMSLFYLENDILRHALEEGRDMNEINEIIEGGETVLPADAGNMAGMRVESGDSAALSDFFNSMLADKDKYAVLMSDDIFALLGKFEIEYSGKSTAVGAGYTDADANAAFLDVRERIIPVISADDGYTKLEYLGYDRVMLSPGENPASDSRVRELMGMENICGVALSERSWLSNLNIWAGSGIPVYIYGTNISAGSAEMPVYLQPWK